MDFHLRGLVWITLHFSILPLLRCDVPCPGVCRCDSLGEVRCDGLAITEIPRHLPVTTFTLKLNDTNIKTLEVNSLAHLGSTIRFSLTHSHLHTIHPQAFHIAPQLKTVKLSSNDLSSLPARVFSPLIELEEVYLDENQLRSISLDMFEGLGGLLSLHLTHNNLTDLPPDVFDGLTNLTILNLGRNRIKKLPPTVFHSLTKLRLLRIYNNEIERLEEGVFDKLVNLEELSLHVNRIESLPPRVFWSLRKLKYLTLSSNRLQAVPPKSFYNMPKLSKLTIYKNPLLSLPAELMGHMPDMREFYLFFTNLTTVPGNVFANMSGLLRLHFHLNDKLQKLPSDVFCCLPHLQKLSLRYNNLSDLDPQLFSSLTTLSVLLLNGNSLRNLSKDIFLNLPGLVSVDLMNNNLISLPGDIFLSNGALRDVRLSDNPWNCTCAIQDIARWIRNNKRVVVDHNDVMCHTPLHQALRTVDSLTDADFSYCIKKGTQSPTTESVQTTSESSTAKIVTYDPTSVTLDHSDQPVVVVSTTPPSKSSTFDVMTFSTPRQTSSIAHTALPLLDKLLVEPGPKYVHHNYYRGWVYVWFLQSSTDMVGLLMFCYCLLLGVGLVLVLAAMYGIRRLNTSMEKLNVENVQSQEKNTLLSGGQST